MFIELANDEYQKWKTEVGKVLDSSGIPVDKPITELNQEEIDKLRSIFRVVSRKSFSRGISFQPYMQGDWSVFSTFLGTQIFDGSNQTIRGLFDFIGEAVMKRFNNIPPWKIFQYFFNDRSDVRIYLNYGFPSVTFTKPAIILTSQWNRYQESAIEKNARKLRFRFSHIVRHPSTTEFENLIGSRTYGVLNQCFNDVRFVSSSFADLIETEKEKNMFRVGEGFIITKSHKIVEVG